MWVWGVDIIVRGRGGRYYEGMGKCFVTRGGADN